jgi:hypothetical protein
MSDTWWPGQYARLSVSIVNANGGAADPGTLTLKVKAPSGTVTSYIYGTASEVVRDALGAFHADVLLSAAGRWCWRWETAAPNAGAIEGDLVVNRSTVL